jgi:hypothetical protein
MVVFIYYYHKYIIIIIIIIIIINAVKHFTFTLQLRCTPNNARISHISQKYFRAVW